MKALSSLLIIALAGCAQVQRKHASLSKASATTEAAVAEESRVLTTAVVDLLAQTNSGLALTLARQDQQLEGLPVQRLDVQPLIAREDKALVALQQRFDVQNELLAKQQVLASKLQVEQNKLAEFGKAHEAARARSFLRRAIGSLGIAGILALCIFVPAVIPLITRLASWTVSKIPILSNFLGIVSRKTFDAVVSGVGRVRASYKAADRKAALSHMDNALTEATTEEQRRFIAHRREELGV